MNKKTISYFTLIAIIGIVSKIISFVIVQFTQWYTLSVITGLLSYLCFLTLVFLIGRDLQQNYFKQLWKVYIFIGYSFLLVIFITIFSVSIDYLSVPGLLYLALCINAAVFFMNSVYQAFGIVFLIIIFIQLISAWAVKKFLPGYIFIETYLDLLPIANFATLLYVVRIQMKKLHEEANSIASIKVEV